MKTTASTTGNRDEQEWNDGGSANGVGSDHGRTDLQWHSLPTFVSSTAKQTSDKQSENNES